MKRILIVFALLLMIGADLKAAPGDTTWVQAHSTVKLDRNGNFDTTIEFPDGSVSYRKIIMTFTLGKYQCPGNPQYCGDWDYTVSLFVLPKTGDTMELSRFITPYANASYARTPWTYKQRYEFDVTDFYNELKDSATIRVGYSGYSWGFTSDIKFAMIEGTPPRNVIKAEKAWSTSSRFGDTSAAAQKIEDRVDVVSMQAPSGTVSTDLRLIISGHGNDDNGCSEFCKKFYEVELNGNKFDKTELWRADCGLNHIYPQSGTWVYDRGNWCPGDVVFPNRHILNGISSGSNFDLDVDFESYIGSNTLPNRSWGSYIVRGNVIYYGAFNKTVDAELENVVAPNNHETFFRYNPTTGRPIVIVRNTGGNSITSIKFKYEMKGGSGVKEYTWNGTLTSLDTAWVEFDPFYDLYKATGANNEFSVEIVEVNGGADEDASNNKFTTKFTAAQSVQNKIVILTQTNSGTINGVGETSWKIIDMFNNVVAAEQKNLAPSTLHKDTLDLTVGMYKLVVEDAGCEGLKWWANPNDGNGYISIRPYGSVSGIPLDGYFAGDFGCGFTQYLNVVWPTAIEEATVVTPSIEVFPNPAQSTVSIAINGIANIKGELQIVDMTGRVVVSQHTTTGDNTVDASALPNGVYTVVYTGNATDVSKLVSRLVITK